MVILIQETTIVKLGVYMPPKEETNALHLISDILDKLIEAQQKNADTNASVSVLLDETVESVRHIKSLFTNGFRSEIKGHITQESEKVIQNQSKILDSIETSNNNIMKVYDALSKPWYWIKLFGTMLGAIAIIITAVWKSLDFLGIK
jgi:hypothetical protein